MLVVRDVELVLVEFLPKDGAAPFARTQTQARTPKGQDRPGPNAPSNGVSPKGG